jgi:hypothetical protein
MGAVVIPHDDRNGFTIPMAMVLPEAVQPLCCYGKEQCYYAASTLH